MAMFHDLTGVTKLQPEPAGNAGSDSVGPLAVFLDFDGTLVDLAPQPDAIDVTGVEGFVAALSKALHGRLVLVSGRSVDDLRRHMPSCDVPIYGSHGAEVWTGNAVVPRVEVPDEMTQMRRSGQAFAKDHPDVLFEDKPLGFALHYRQAPELEAPVHDMLHQLTENEAGISLQDAKMAFEVKPTGVDKGAAVRDAMARFGWEDAVPVMIGDDVTDEAGMTAAAQMGGFGIKVGEGPTVARWRIDSPSALRRTLSTYFGIVS